MSLNNLYQSLELWEYFFGGFWKCSYSWNKSTNSIIFALNYTSKQLFFNSWIVIVDIFLFSIVGPIVVLISCNLGSNICFQEMSALKLIALLTTLFAYLIGFIAECSILYFGEEGFHAVNQITRLANHLGMSIIAWL